MQLVYRVCRLACVSLILVSILSHKSFAQNPDYSNLSDQQLLEKAEQGDAHAFYSLGFNLIFEQAGQSVDTTNILQAMEFVKKADDLGHDDAPSLVALYYYGELGGEPNARIAKNALKRGIERGAASSKINFAVRHIDSDNAAEAQQSLNFFSELSENENFAAVALPQLVDIFSFGNQHIEVDLEKGRKYARRCVTEIEPADTQCLYMYAQYLKSGWGGDAVPISSTQYYRRAAEDGDERAQWHYAMALLNGLGTEIDEVEAYKWVSRSAEQEYMDGLISFAVMNALGQGTEINNDLAFSSYEKAAKLGSVHAIRGLSIMFIQGQGTEKNVDLGTAALLIANDGGDEHAPMLLQQVLGNPDDLEIAISAKRATLRSQIEELRKRYQLTPYN